MTDSKQAPLAKVVLEATCYEDIAEKSTSVPHAKTIDITSLLAENGIYSMYGINGITTREEGCDGSYDSVVPTTLWVVDPRDIEWMRNDVKNIMDAAIVNAKQSEAVKRLIDDRFEKFNSRQWKKIHTGDM